MSDSITFGASWGIGIAVIVFLFIALVGMIFVGMEKQERDGFFGVLAGFMAGANVLVILITLGALYPYKHEYHYWQTKQGVVTEATSRLLGSGDTLSEFVIVEFEDGFVGRCDDGRCKVLDKGDTVILRCKKEWQYEGTDGWDCRFVDRKKANG